MRRLAETAFLYVLIGGAVSLGAFLLFRESAFASAPLALSFTEPTVRLFPRLVDVLDHCIGYFLHVLPVAGAESVVLHWIMKRRRKWWYPYLVSALIPILFMAMTMLSFSHGWLAALMDLLTGPHSDGSMRTLWDLLSLAGVYFLPSIITGLVFVRVLQRRYANTGKVVASPR